MHLVKRHRLQQSRQRQQRQQRQHRQGRRDDTQSNADRYACADRNDARLCSGSAYGDA